MQFDPESLSPNQVYALMIRAITPRPIAWVSTISEKGIPNLAPFSYFAGVASKPASLLFSVANRPDGSLKDTMRNLRLIPQFVVNVVPYQLAEPMFKTSEELEYESSEFEHANLLMEPSRKVSPPRVGSSPIRMECEVLQIIPVGEGAGGSKVVIGRILLFDVSNDVLDSDGKIDPAKVDSIGRLGGMGYCRTRERFELGQQRSK
jgi:flavin reductase (DIM6/NTAB) family NADH-FMN oxidoreductase RutF